MVDMIGEGIEGHQAPGTFCRGSASWPRLLVEDDSLNTERRMAWDEENRLMALSDNGKTSRYTYLFRTF